MKTKIWFLLASLVVGAALIWFLVEHFSSAVPVEAVRVTTGPIKEFVDERAVTRLPETYLITMPFAGRIESIDLTEGTPVKKGEDLARIVPLDLGLTVEEATAVVAEVQRVLTK